jgi:CrcB protein
MTSGTVPASPRPSLRAGVLATGAGGALGAVLRWSLSSAFPVAAGHFPWTVFAINVAGAGLLAGLPMVALVRSRPWLPVFLGTGVLGGFTTMSAASADTFALLDGGHVDTGLSYCLGTLLAALAAVLLVDRLTTTEQRQEFESAEGDE